MNFEGLRKEVKASRTDRPRSSEKKRMERVERPQVPKPNSATTNGVSREERAKQAAARRTA